MSAGCSIEGCDRPVKTRGWCNAHYLRWRRHGDPLGTGIPLKQTRTADGLCSLDGCDRRYFGRGLCSRHWARLTRHGDVDKLLKRPTGGLRAEVEAAARDTSDGPCLLLTGHRRRPTVHLDGVGVTASRAVWILANGDPGDLHVLHICGAGREGCIRLTHLHLGTNADNGKDAARDGAMARGERHHAARLTEGDVREIRGLLAAGRLRGEIAPMFGVTYSAIRCIDEGTSWAWLTDQAGAA